MGQGNPVVCVRHRTTMVADVTGDMPPLNLAVFYVSNLPYVVIDILAGIWVIARFRKDHGPATSAGVVSATHWSRCRVSSDAD
jgi:hypothetical protein